MNLTDQFNGTVCIRKGNLNQEPSAVYVAGLNSFDSLVCYQLNTGNIVWANPDGDALIPFDHKELQRLRLEWKLEKAKQQINTLQERITKGDY